MDGYLTILAKFGMTIYRGREGEGEIPNTLICFFIKKYIYIKIYIFFSQESNFYKIKIVK